MSSSTGFSVSGLGSGIDWSAYIQSIRNAKTGALNRTLGKKSIHLSSEQTVFGNIQNLVGQFQAVAKGFAFSKDFLAKTVTSSDTAVVTGTASLNAINQSNTIDVRQLATNEIWQASFSSVDGSVTSSDQSLTITVRGSAKVVSVPAGTTLKGLASLINEQNIGVSASVFDMGDGSATPARISITDNNIGKGSTDQTAGINFNLAFSSALTDLSTAAFGVAPVVEGMDSQVRINGSASTIYRDTNTLTDVIPGVVLTLISADAGNAKTLTINSSTSTGTQKVTDFIKKYNDLLKELRKDVKFDLNLAQQGLDQSNPTAGNSTIRSMISQLQTMITSSVTTLPQGKTIRSLTDLGITAAYTGPDSPDNGTLTLDEGKLNRALATNFDDVVTFFEGVQSGGITYDGLSQKLTGVIDGFIDSQNGSITAFLRGVNAESKRVNEDIQKKLAQMQKQEDLLKDRFARLETTLAQLNRQGDQLSAMFSSITGSNKKK